MDPNRIQSVAFTPGKMIMARLKAGSDLLGGISEVCAAHEIQYGSIVSAIGSLSHATIIYVVPDENAEIGVAYIPPKRLAGPLELLSAQGFIGLTGKGERSIHLHGTVSTPEMKVIGGHFTETGNRVLATVELMIQENREIRMLREPDVETGFSLFKFYGHRSDE